MIFREVTLPALAKPLTKMVTFQDYRRPLVLKRGINCSNLAVKRPCNGLWNAHLQDAKNPRSLNVYKIMHRIISPFTSDGKDVAWFESSIWTGYMMLIFIERKLFAGLQISENVVSIPQWWSHISIWKQDHSVFPYQWHPPARILKDCIHNHHKLHKRRFPNIDLFYWRPWALSIAFLHVSRDWAQ